MEKIQLTYHELAETNGSYVVSSCGMDSVPVDVGVLHFSKNFNGENISHRHCKKLKTSSSYQTQTAIVLITWELTKKKKPR